MEAEYS